MTKEQLKIWRDMKGIPQVTAACLLRVPVQTYRNWEYGTSPIPGPAEVAIELITQKDNAKNEKK